MEEKKTWIERLVVGLNERVTVTNVRNAPVIPDVGLHMFFFAPLPSNLLDTLKQQIVAALVTAVMDSVEGWKSISRLPHSALVDKDYTVAKLLPLCYKERDAFLDVGLNPVTRLAHMGPVISSNVICKDGKVIRVRFSDDTTYACVNSLVKDLITTKGKPEMDAKFKVIDEGHKYQLSDGQQVRFIRKERVNVDGIEKLRTVYTGTTTEELLEVLIDRTYTLNQAVSCRENEEALDHMRNALFCLGERTRNREKQNVEGTSQKHQD